MGLDRLLRDLRQRTDPVLDAAAVAAKPLGRVFDGAGHERTDHQEDRRECGVQIEHVGHQTDDREAVAHQGGNRRCCRGGDVFDVIGELGEDVSRALIVVIARRGAQQVLEHLLAQIRDHTPPDPAQTIVVDEAGDPAKHEERHQHERHEADDLLVAVHEAAVDQRLHHGREERLGGREGKHGDDRDGEHPPVGFDVAEQPAIDGTRLDLGA